MEYISQDSSGIPNKQLYKMIARHFKTGIFTPRKIEFLKARNLDSLSLRNDSITDLNFLKFFPKLEDLSIASSNLRDISGLQHTPGMDLLSISKHALTDISAISYCPELTCLHIETFDVDDDPAEARISDFHVITRCRNLSEIWLEYNYLEDISWIPELKNLQEVFISHNPIKDFSPLKELPGLKLLEVSHDQNIDPNDFLHVSVEYDG